MIRCPTSANSGRRRTIRRALAGKEKGLPLLEQCQSFLEPVRPLIGTHDASVDDMTEARFLDLECGIGLLFNPSAEPRWSGNRPQKAY